MVVQGRKTRTEPGLQATRRSFLEPSDGGRALRALALRADALLRPRPMSACARGRIRGLSALTIRGRAPGPDSPSLGR